MQPVYEEILRRVGEAYYGEGVNRTPADAVLELLKNRGETVTFAESCTGGLLCGAFVDCAGASDCLKESFVTYANEAKEQMLGVKSETLARCGAVSGECAREMALGGPGGGGRLGGIRHRHCRARRRHGGKAGGHRVDRRRSPGRGPGPGISLPGSAAVDPQAQRRQRPEPAAAGHGAREIRGRKSL